MTALVFFFATLFATSLALVRGFDFLLALVRD
jgi:hypothetical protein